MELDELSDTWEFQQTKIMKIRDKLRSIRVKLAVLEGKMSVGMMSVCLSLNNLFFKSPYLNICMIFLIPDLSVKRKNLRRRNRRTRMKQRKNRVCLEQCT